MRKLAVFISLLFIVLAFGSAEAQTNLVVGVSGEYSYNFGYDYYTNASLGVRHISRGLDLSVSGSYGLSPKIETGNGYHYGAAAEIYWASPRRFVLLGGGVSYVKQITSAWEKSSLRPNLSIGLGSDEVRNYLTYYLPPKKLDIDPWIYGPAVSWNMDWQFARKWHVYAGLHYSSVQREDQDKPVNGLGASLGLAKYF